MLPTENKNFRQKAGRREKPLPDDANPRTILAARLRELKSASGSPTYDELARLSGVYKTGLLEAASATRLPRWHVVKGYVEGCWKHYDIRFSEPLAHAGDLLQWQQLYRAAGGTLPDECPPPTPRHDEQAKRRLVLAHHDEPAEPASQSLTAASRPSPAGGLPPAGTHLQYHGSRRPASGQHRSWPYGPSGAGPRWLSLSCASSSWHGQPVLLCAPLPRRRPLSPR